MRPEDTSPEAWRVLVDIYRRMSPDEKLQRAFDLSEFVRSASEAGIRSQYPDASDREVFLVRYSAEMNQTAALHMLIQALEGAGVRYLIGGSVASSSRGLPGDTRYGF